MKSLPPALLLLLLASTLALGEPTPLPRGGPPGVEESIASWLTEQRQTLPTVEQTLRDEEARGRAFHANLVRMRSDAAAQRATLALANLRTSEITRAAENWKSWKALAQARLGEVKAVSQLVGERRSEQEERWSLLGDQPPGSLSPEAAQSYGQAQALQQQMLGFLGRLATVAAAGVHDAESAVALCDDVLALIERTVAKLQARFFFERVTVSSLANAREDLERDLVAFSRPFVQAMQIDWRGQWADGLQRSAQILLSGLLLLGFAVLWGRRWVRRLESAARRRDAFELSLPRRLAVDLLLALTRCVTLAVLTGAALLLASGLESAPPVWLGALISILWAALFWRLAVAFIDVAFDPAAPGYRLFELSEEATILLRRRLKRVAHWLFVSLTLAALFRSLGLPSPPLMVVFLVVQLVALRSVTRPLADDKLGEIGLGDGWMSLARQWRGFLRGAFVVLIGTAGLGYVNLAWFAAWCLLEVHALLIVASLLWRVGMDLLDEWGKPLDAATRRSLGNVWTTALVTLLVVSLPLLTGLGSVARRWMWAILTAGGEVGGRPITVGSVLGAILCVVGAWAVGRVVNAVLTRRVLPHATTDTGVREAVTATVGYLVMAVGVLFGIHVLGFDLTSFAIVAGALSVGAGFGMQTLVSNFVSGLIILYERPFRTGDILEHGGVMGSVKAIHTRSTIVQTFDDAELVLPNSELLSKPITNWTLSNYRTRATLPIGVAYGSDVELVRETLLEVAAAHSRVIEEPRVFFVAFGDSSLDFKLMVWVDIREKMQVVSDLYFAVDRAFREKRIEIPFPRRDVRLVAPGGVG